MAVKIRLKRLGKVRVPQYRIVVVDSRKKRDGRVIEEIGKYHPKEDPSYIDVVTDRGVRIKFGDGQNVGYKLELWQKIAEQAKKESITPNEIDLRFGQWAAVR